MGFNRGGVHLVSTLRNREREDGTKGIDVLEIDQYKSTSPSLIEIESIKSDFKLLFFTDKIKSVLPG